MSKWKYTSYLQKGLSHKKAGTKCQDSVLVKEDEHCLVAALADGLGSLKYSEVAATTATLAVWELFSSLGGKEIKIESDGAMKAFTQELVQKITQKIHNKAEDMGLHVSAMDCTLVFVYISKDHNYAITGRLGDSAICIITKDGSIAINDSNHSANGTSAILDEDAHDHMEISFWDLDAESIYGFILTSDGLDNELYRKGSQYVNKAAEAYFNSLVLSSDPQEVIKSQIAELIQDADSPYDDDISLAVLSRATKAIVLPEDPTWLCTCGERNRLQDTYCFNCGKDFSILYQKVRFREYGGKNAFFLEINKHPEKEARIIGLHTASEQAVATPKPAVQQAEYEPMNLRVGKVEKAASAIIPNKSVNQNRREPMGYADAMAVVTGKPVRKTMENKRMAQKRSIPDYVQMLAAVGAICLLVGMFLGSMLTKNAMKKTNEELAEKIPSQTESRQDPPETQTTATEANEPEEKVTEPAENTETEPVENTETEPVESTETEPAENTETEPEEKSETKPPLMRPQNILATDQGVYYWGETEANLPHGYGIYLQNGYYYVGNFVQGKKDGEFIVVQKDKPGREYLLIYYKDNEIVADMLSFDKYAVTGTLLNVRDEAGLNSNVIMTLQKDDIVYRTDAPVETKDGVDWVEVICNGVVGWVAAKYLSVM